jgi:proline iminopeptidase
MASIPAYNEYAKTVLMPAMPRAVLDEVLAIEAAKQYEAPRYLELLIPHFYELHILRRPFAEWPEPAVRSFTHLSRKLYVAMQGPSEMGASGILERWDRFADLPSIEVPTLVIGAAHDTMDPAYMKRMADRLPRGRYLHCPDGSHMAIYDDQATYMAGVLGFLRDVDGGSL